MQLIAQFEGTVSHMYLDTRGYVTVGVGCLLATPQTAIALVWERRGGGAEPNEVEIADEWTRVHRAVQGLHHTAYLHVTTMDLHELEIARLFRKRVDDFCRELAEAFPLWPEYPEQAQVAMLDLAFNLGTSGLVQKFPRLRVACRTMDWRTAALECIRPGARDARNRAVRGLFEEAATAGAIPRGEIA
jgi:GH24 family phage-related lysozyme (muramidase)